MEVVMANQEHFFIERPKATGQISKDGFATYASEQDGSHFEARSNPCLTLEVALTLIAEKVHFWSDEPNPRCLDAARLPELRQSLIEISGHCKAAMQTSPEGKGYLMSRKESEATPS
jgi:hypothetical protein